MIGVWNGFSQGIYLLRAHHVWIISSWIRWSNTPFDNGPLRVGLGVTLVPLLPEMCLDLFSRHKNYTEGVKGVSWVERAFSFKERWIKPVFPPSLWLIWLLHLIGNKIMFFSPRLWKMRLVGFPLTLPGFRQSVGIVIWIRENLIVHKSFHQGFPFCIAV